MRRVGRVQLLRRSSSLRDGAVLPMVNALQAVFAQAKQEFDLPQIVVCGAQSSGKSSVVEALVGHGDFLPRGRGIVTRCPLVLQLMRPSEGERETWAEFAHDARFSGKRFTDFARVRQTIVEETDRIAGRQRGVSSHPIVLRVTSPQSVPLTLVDTPGLTRIAVEGQPSDIEDQIKKMVSSFIEKPNSIILAVSPATMDIATSDSMRLARNFDPMGERTIGVLTKLDIMDRGTDCMDVLSGRVVPLRLGYVGVVCRSQQDIDSGKSLSDSLQDEQRFFASHPVYQGVAHLNGVPYLATKCNQLLVAHIKKVLPKLKQSIKGQISTLSRDLERLGEAPAPADATQRGFLMLRLIGDFSNAFRGAIEGHRTLEDLRSAKLNGGARIRHIFSDVFERALERIDPLHGLDDKDIQAAIQNAAGPRPAIFLPELAFDQLAKRQIRKLLEPALECIDRVHSELLKIMLEMDRESLSQYVHLSDKILESGQRVLRKTTGPTATLIREIIEAECSFINTQHKDFVGLQMLSDPAKYKFEGGKKPESAPSVGSSSGGGGGGGGFLSSLWGSSSSKSAEAPRQETSTKQPVDFSSPTSPSERELFQISLLKTLLQSYFSVVRKNVQDITVKIVWRNVVEKAKDELQRQLMADLYKPELFDALLRENPQVQSQRVLLRERLATLRSAKEVISLQEVRAADGRD